MRSLKVDSNFLFVSCLLVNVLRRVKDVKKFFALVSMLSLFSPALAEEVGVQAQPLAVPMSTQEVFINPDSMIQVKKTATVLETKMRRKYAGYHVEVTSLYPGTLKLESASIDNGVIGHVAAQRSKTSWAHILWGLPGGWIGLPIAAIIVSSKNGHVETEASEYPNQIPLNTLSKNWKVIFNALVPIGQQPEIRMHFVDPANSAVTFDKVAALY
jgi:hypothetical protein